MNEKLEAFCKIFNVPTDKAIDVILDYIDYDGHFDEWWEDGKWWKEEIEDYFPDLED